MRRDAIVIEHSNKALRHELTSVNQAASAFSRHPPGQPYRSSFTPHAARAAMATALMVWSVAAVLAQQPPGSAPAEPATPPSASPPPEAAPAAPAQPKLSPAMASWDKALVARVGRFQRYPAQAHGAEGVVTLGFSIDRQGHVVSSRIVKSSGSAVLDADALTLIKRAAPLPAPPADIADVNLSFVVPIRYGAR